MSRAYRALGRAEAVVAGTFLMAMVLLVFLGGIARLLHHPLNWTIDVATCLFAWACFLSADIAWRSNGLMAIGLVSARLSERGRRLLAAVNHLLICGFLVYLIWAGVRLSWLSRARSFQGIPEVSYSWVTMSLPVGAALLLLTTLLKLRELRAAEPRPSGRSA
jgi:TRAP-type C4-dicarboxylate transport system permease small subunit